MTNLTLKEKLKKMLDDGSHGISFTPNKKSVDIYAVKLFDAHKKENEPEFEKYPSGYMYHIVLYNMNNKGDISNIEKFEAILTGPEVYLENIIKSNYYGFIVKKTKQDFSQKFTKSIYNNICNLQKK